GRGVIGVPGHGRAPGRPDHFLPRVPGRRVLPDRHGIARVGRRRRPGPKSMLAVLALDAPAEVFGPDPQVGAVTVGTGYANVIKHNPSVTPIVEPGNGGSRARCGGSPGGSLRALRRSRRVPAYQPGSAR